MSKIFSVDSSWCLTGYFVLMATEVFYCSCVFSLWFPHHPSFQRCARCCFYGNLVGWFPCCMCHLYLGSTGNCSIDGEWRSHLSPLPNTGRERSALRLSLQEEARTQVEVPHCVCPWYMMLYAAAHRLLSECTAFLHLTLSSVECGWKGDGGRCRLWERAGYFYLCYHFLDSL